MGHGKFRPFERFVVGVTLWYGRDWTIAGIISNKKSVSGDTDFFLL